MHIQVSFQCNIRQISASTVVMDVKTQPAPILPERFVEELEQLLGFERAGMLIEGFYSEILREQVCSQISVKRNGKVSEETTC